MFIALVSFLFRVHVGKLGLVTNFRPTIVGGTAKHSISTWFYFATVR